jgi:hypothetical protein
MRVCEFVQRYLRHLIGVSRIVHMVQSSLEVHEVIGHVVAAKIGRLADWQIGRLTKASAV